MLQEPELFPEHYQLARNRSRCQNETDEVSLCLARGLTFDHPHICLRLTDL